MLHIFDIDKTVVQTSTVKEALYSGIRKGVIPLSLLAYVPFFFILFGLSGVREKHFSKPLRFLKGLSENDLNFMAEQLYKNRFSRMVFPEIEELFKTIKSNSEDIIIASASFNFILKPLAEGLGIERMVCTELEFEEGKSTGRIKGLPAFKEAKHLRVQNYIRSMGIGLSDCCFYTDSHRDLSLLNEVGTAVAVNPDRILRKTAEKNGWKIIDVIKHGRIKTWQT